MAKQLIKVFSHNDLDGFGGPMLLQSVQPTVFSSVEFDVEHIGAGQIDATLDHWFNSPSLNNYSDVYIMDMTPDSENTFKELNQHFANHWLVFDHHESEEDQRRRYAANTFAPHGEMVHASATSIVWDWLQQQPGMDQLDSQRRQQLAQLAELIRAYDTWDWQNDPELPTSVSEGADQLNELFWFYPKKRAGEFMDHVFAAGWDAYWQDNELLVHTLMERRAAYIKHHLKDVLETTVNGHRLGVVYASDYQSQLAHDLLKDQPELDAALVIGAMRISLRSNDKMDVAKFAEQYYQGGGHAKAAGGRLTINPVKIGEQAVIDQLVSATKAVHEEKQDSEHTLADDLDPEVAGKLAALLKQQPDEENKNGN